IRVCFGPVCLISCERSFSLRQRGLEWAWIDLKKKIALFHLAAFLVIARHDVALHLRVDVGVNESVERCDAFKHSRYITRLHGCHLNFRRGRTGLRRFARTTFEHQRANQERADKRKWLHQSHYRGSCPEVSSTSANRVKRFNANIPPVTRATGDVHCS